jgi:thiol:disulfide interchange protein
MSKSTFSNRTRESIVRLRGWLAGREQWLWAAVVMAVVILQWPILKGFSYRAAEVPPPPSSIEWRTDLSAALQESQRTGMPVLVDFTADWCPPCIAMKHDVWPNDAVEDAVAQSYIPVLIDVDSDSSVSARYGVRAIPTILVLDASGQVMRRGSFFSASRMVQFLADIP